MCGFLLQVRLPIVGELKKMFSNTSIWSSVELSKHLLWQLRHVSSAGDQMIEYKLLDTNHANTLFRNQV